MFDQQEQHTARPVALIGHGLWTRRYGSDPRVLGKTVLVNEVSHVVIGVLPPGFEFPPYVATDVVVAGLLLKSFIRLQRIDLGVNPREAVTANLVLSKRYLDPRTPRSLRPTAAGFVAAVQACLDVAVHTDPPFLGGGSAETFTVEDVGDPGPDRGHVAGFDVVSGNFFRAMGYADRARARFDARDTAAAPPVAIVNETMARRLWPEREAVGKRVRLYYDKDRQHWLTIVGVVRDVRYRGARIEPIPQIFVPSRQNPYRTLPYVQSPAIALVVRTAAKPATMIPAVQAAIWAVDKDQPVWNLQPMDQALWESGRCSAPLPWLRSLSPARGSTD
jgi:hypothetical protein